MRVCPQFESRQHDRLLVERYRLKQLYKDLKRAATTRQRLQCLATSPMTKQRFGPTLSRAGSLLWMRRSIASLRATTAFV